MFNNKSLEIDGAEYLRKPIKAMVPLYIFSPMMLAFPAPPDPSRGNRWQMHVPTDSRESQFEKIAMSCQLLKHPVPVIGFAKKSHSASIKP